MCGGVVVVCVHTYTYVMDFIDDIQTYTPGCRVRDALLLANDHFLIPGEGRLVNLFTCLHFE